MNHLKGLLLTSVIIVSSSLVAMDSYDESPSPPPPARAPHSGGIVASLSRKIDRLTRKASDNYHGKAANVIWELQHKQFLNPQSLESLHRLDWAIEELVEARQFEKLLTLLELCQEQHVQPNDKTLNIAYAFFREIKTSHCQATREEILEAREQAARYKAAQTLARILGSTTTTYGRDSDDEDYASPESFLQKLQLVEEQQVHFSSNYSPSAQAASPVRIAHTAVRSPQPTAAATSAQRDAYSSDDDDEQDVQAAPQQQRASPPATRKSRKRR